MKKLFSLVMAVLMVGSVVLMVMVIRGKTSVQKIRDQSEQLIEQANAATSKAQAELEKAEQIAQGMHEQFSKLKEEYDRITRIIVDPAKPPSQEELAKAHASTANVKAELKKTQTELDVARRMVAELREGLRPPVVGKPTRPPSRGDLPLSVGFFIRSHDPINDFYVIDGGSSNGFKKGDILTVFRKDKPIGKIEIARVQPTLSIAVYQKGSPRPSAPFKNGDRVWKSE